MILFEDYYKLQISYSAVFLHKLKQNAFLVQKNLIV
jgi:hypothetical protein